MLSAADCGQCGKAVAANAPSGLCPSCLLRTAIEHGAGHTLAPLLPKLRYFGDYELLEEIARGGMGVVYRARQVSLSRIVAIKMMRPGVLSTEDEIRRFQAEARTAASMQHPNIVAIHEVGELDGLHYFSMDFVEGPSLAELVRQGPLAPKEAARYVQTLTDAVHYAHGKGILHRDLKPSNVLVDAAGRPRITDFGLARHMEGGSDLTVTGAMIGTPAYMPPEQAAAGSHPLTPASDCYSLGAILYELLTGRPPFQAAGPIAIVRMVQEEKPASPRAINANIGRDVEAICMRCLEKDPARRYQSAADLGADLDRFLNGEPVQAQVTRSWPGRWLILAAAAMAMALILWAVLRNERSASFHVSAPPQTPGMQIAVSTPPPLAAPPEVDETSPVTTMSTGSGGIRVLASRSMKAEPKTKLAPAPDKPQAKPQPVGDSVDPNIGSGARQSFTFRYSEPEGAPPVSAVEVEFRDVATNHVCRIFLQPDSDNVQLQADPEKGPGLRRGGRLGGFEALENAACALDLSAIVYVHRDRSFEVRIPIAFKPAFSGAKEISSWPLQAPNGSRLESHIHGTWTVTN